MPAFLKFKRIVILSETVVVSRRIWASRAKHRVFGDAQSRVWLASAFRMGLRKAGMSDRVPIA